MFWPGVGSFTLRLPAGGQIAYVAPSRTTGSDATWVMRPDGSRKRQLTYPDVRHGDGFPHYSPDGRHIIFNRGGGGRAPRVFVMRSDGSLLHRVDCGGVYSPNGRRITWAGQVGPYETDIFTSTVRCTDPFRVTHYGDPATTIGAKSPSWQPLPGS